MTAEELYQKYKNHIIHCGGRKGEVVGYAPTIYPNPQIMLAINKNSVMLGWLPIDNQYAYNYSAIFKRRNNEYGYWFITEIGIDKVILPFKFGR